ncbi:MAG: hypothetical protein HY423_08200 [Candidatus Lambdaproteobacteria bacterium]|nr:hypothetical protein [Candidatus Lambdaproteobacteria bacterium]
MLFRKKKVKDKSLREKLQSHDVARFIHVTEREDWPTLSAELFKLVIANCTFGVAAITKIQDGRIRRLELKVNPDFPNEEIPRFIRRNFRIGHYDGIFHSVEGLEQEGAHDLYRIVSPKLGLPMNSLIYRVEHKAREDLKALLVFGGERLEGQMENRLRMVAELMEAPTSGEVMETEPEVLPQAPGEDTSAVDALLARLRQFKIEMLASTDPSEVAELVNGLEEVIMHQPAPLQLKYKVLQEHFVKQRTGGEPAAKERAPQPTWRVSRGPDHDRS